MHPVWFLNIQCKWSDCRFKENDDFRRESRLLLTILTESIKSMQTSQTENNKLHSDLLKLMSRQLEMQETSLNVAREAWTNITNQANADDSHERRKWSNKPKPVRPSVDTNIDDILNGVYFWTNGTTTKPSQSWRAPKKSVSNSENHVQPMWTSYSTNSLAQRS